MAIPVPRRLVEYILLGPENDRRQVQDSPILGDVWMEYAKNPAARLDLLITPFKDQPTGEVALALAKRLDEPPPDQVDREDDGKRSDVAYIHGVLAARLYFEELIRLVMPMTYWWNGRGIGEKIDKHFREPGLLEQDIQRVLRSAFRWFSEQKNQAESLRMHEFAVYKRYVALAGIFLWAAGKATQDFDRGTDSERIRAYLGGREEGIANLAEIMGDKLRRQFPMREREKGEGTVYSVSLNRTASPATKKSVPAVKGDAARSLFKVNCGDIAWAVLDAGVDATHEAFHDANGKSRVTRAFDFTRIRHIVNLANRDQLVAEANAAELIAKGVKEDPVGLAKNLSDLADAAKLGRAIDWKLVESLVEIPPWKPPPSAGNHGTHVAGIIGADAEAAKKAIEARGEVFDDTWSSGMCPDIRIFDFRVIGADQTQVENEFSIIGALQFIRYLNDRNPAYLTIHGANLSLSIPHDVRNYACGRTPICNECERLINSGVVVVAAAGNRGYQNFETSDGSYEGYAAFSITDPGNADGVITVGATHRFWPHTYGVSFFSSRGPTGDGRLKPDLVAPGERIRAPFPSREWGDLDGTSMAAPHVSGAAAMLMARYSELIGQPRRIKKILCETATNLGRERSFQGAGMLDVLRAFQSI